MSVKKMPPAALQPYDAGFVMPTCPVTLAQITEAEAQGKFNQIKRGYHLAGYGSYIWREEDFAVVKSDDDKGYAVFIGNMLPDYNQEQAEAMIGGYDPFWVILTSEDSDLASWTNETIELNKPLICWITGGE
jgi:hypothetical protein